jgi:PAS domain S-box-containing protein
MPGVGLPDRPGTPPASAAPASAPAEPDPTSRRDPIAWAMALLGVFVAGYSLVWALRLGNPTEISRFTGAAAVPGGVLVALVAIRLAHTARMDVRTRRAWALITFALIGYGMGALIHFLSGTVPALGAAWPITVGLQMATYGLVLVALAWLPKPPRTTYDIVLFGLDVALVAWSAAMLIWHFVIFPVARNAGQDLVATVGAAMFPTADLTLVFVIVAIILRGLRESTAAALSIAAAALVIVFFGDMIAGIEALKGTYTQGGASGVLYSIAWLGMALAVYVQWRIKDSDRPIRGLADYARSLPWLPYVVVVVAFVAPTISDWNDIDMLRQHIPATGLLMALLFARLVVTARQDASLAALERERLAAAVDQAAEAIMTTDQTGRVSYINPAFSRMTGYPASEILGHDSTLLRELADQEPLGEMTAALVRGESWGGRLLLKRPDGASLEIDMAISPLRDSAGATSGTLAVARDISHESALEAQLAQAQRMEAIGRLAGGIAHDFNNILTAISGFAELAVDELPDDHPVAADVAQILRASDRAVALTRALLAFSRRQVMQATLINLNDVLDGLIPMLGRLIGEDVHLVVHPDPDLGLTMADRAQLEQVVLNLTVNARDAMPSGGTLTIATANVDLDATAARSHVGASEGPYVALTVADTGIGMTKDVLEHAFEPFFTTKERGKGTGLGLSTAIGIIAQSGGFLDVESEPNLGSSFTVHLPRREGVTLPDEEAGSRDRPAGGIETILVAEDEDAVREFARRVLTKAGYRVMTAQTGAEALATAAVLPRLDLLLTDVVMPGMSGVALAAALAATRPGLPVLYASGYAEEAILRAALDDENVPYLPKPFTSQALLKRVREVLDRRTTLARQASPPPGPDRST